MPKIIERDKVISYGPYAVMEGEVIFHENYGEVKSCWVERDGKITSRFGDIDYAMVRGKMLSENPDAPDIDGIGLIDIVDHVGSYTLLRSVFNHEFQYWVVGNDGRPRTSPGSWDQAYEWAMKNTRLH